MLPAYVGTDGVLYQRIFVRWQHDFCGRGEEWKTCFEELRDAMGLSDDYSPGAEGGGACCDL